MSKYLFDKLKAQAEFLKVLVETGYSHHVCKKKAKMVKNLATLTLENFDRVWFKGALYGFKDDVSMSLYLMEAPDISRTNFDRYHKSLVRYLRKTSLEADFKAVIRSYRGVKKFITSEDWVVVESWITEIQKLLSKKKNSGQIKA